MEPYQTIYNRLSTSDIKDINKYIRQRNCQLKTKKPYNQMITRLKVESGRVELPSKQGSKELSTRLFSDWIFDSLLGQKQPQTT